jgi:hypothetical protein
MCETCADAMDDTSVLSLADHECEGDCSCACNESLCDSWDGTNDEVLCTDCLGVTLHGHDPKDTCQLCNEERN